MSTRWIDPFAASPLRSGQAGRLDWARVFGRSAPRIVDIGCGTGEFLIASAASRPTHDHLGIDEVPAIIDKAVKAADARGLANVRFVCADAVTWLFERLASSGVERLGELDEIHVLHPQPYDEGREALVSARFLECAWAALKPEGILVLQTDSKPYWNYLLKAVKPWFDAEAEDVEAEPRTHREAVARKKKLKVWRMVARPRVRALEVAAVPVFRPTRKTRKSARNERTRDEERGR